MPRPLDLPVEPIQRVMQRRHRAPLSYGEPRHLAHPPVDQVTRDLDWREPWIDMLGAAEHLSDRRAQSADPVLREQAAAQAYAYCRLHGLLRRVGKRTLTKRSIIDAHANQQIPGGR